MCVFHRSTLITLKRTWSRVGTHPLERRRETKEQKGSGITGQRTEGRKQRWQGEREGGRERRRITLDPCIILGDKVFPRLRPSYHLRLTLTPEPFTAGVWGQRVTYMVKLVMKAAPGICI